MSTDINEMESALKLEPSLSDDELDGDTFENDTGNEDQKQNIMEDDLDDSDLDGDLDAHEDIDITESQQPAWLIKLPPFLREKWCNAHNQEGVDLGTITYKRDARGQPTQISIVLPQTQAWCNDIPKQYQLFLKQDTPPDVYVFNEDSVTHQAKRICGKVVKEGSINPVFNDEYRHIMLNRAKAIDNEKPQIKMVEERKELGHHMIQAQDSKLDKTFNKQSTIKTQIQDRRERISRDELINLLFNMFEQQPHWKFKDLLARTQQPQAYLKEVLFEICILNKRGPYLGNYELKPEFKRQEEIINKMDETEIKDDDDDLNDFNDSDNMEEL